MKLAFDMSSVMWTSLLVGRDMDGSQVDHNGKQVHINTAEFGYENAVNLINAALAEYDASPIDMVMVFEGRDSKSKRCAIDPLYKSGDSRPPEAYLEFQKLRDMLKTAYKSLGAISLTQDFAEGDDVLAWLAVNTEDHLVIVTNDNDLIVLNTEANAYGARVDVRINKEVGLNKYGDFDLKLVTLYKALVGDASDKIKGVPGFGASAWLNINARYDDDGCFEIMDLIRRGQRDELATIARDNSCKFLQRIVDFWDDARRCLHLVTLRPDWVNTVKQGLQWEAGMVVNTTTDSRLRKWAQATRLVHADNYEAALAYLKEQLRVSPFYAFDIETSTPDDSDDWLEALGDPEGVDMYGSELAGFSLTFGKNLNKTYYVSVNHREESGVRNITHKQAREMIETCFGLDAVIQNTMFELTVLYQTTDEDGTSWGEAWKKYGQKGFIPRILDTKLEASYVNENLKNGLKNRSKTHLGYDQVSYKETMTHTGHPDQLWPGGKVLAEAEDADGAPEVTKLYKMREIPASAVLAYGADDTITTASLHNFYKLHMQLEHHYEVYKDCELNAAYLHAASFLSGFVYDVAEGKSQEQHDREVYDGAWEVLKNYLTEKGWEGTVPPTYSADLTAAQIKEAYKIVMGVDDDEEDEEVEEGSLAEAVGKVVDPFLSTRVRTPAKLVALLRSQGHDEFAGWVEACLNGDVVGFTAYVRQFFTGKPRFKASNKQMVKLLYETMGLPVVVRNKPTAVMKAKGIREGNPKGDAVAIAWALKDCAPELKQVLESIKLMQMVRTRDSLYYSKYPYFMHWKDGKIHSSHNQCETNTRRASESKPNKQQLPKHQKIEGQPAKFRETILPHKKNAVVVSLDFKSQELRVIADYSQDANMLACFVGDDLKDMHCLTGLSIIQKKYPKEGWTYERFVEVLADEGHPDFKKVKEARSKGKTTNFATEYGAMADKLSLTLLVPSDEAQTYIDAREDTFPDVKRWKAAVVDEAQKNGYVTTMMGARRHLAELLNSPDRFTASKADRQAVNFKVQSSSAEMTKKAEGRMWEKDLLGRFDCQYIGPIHDEVVWSVVIEDLVPFIQDLHWCMVQPYGGMNVPIESSVSFGPSFGVQFEAGDSPTKEAIEAALAKMQEKQAEAVAA